MIISHRHGFVFVKPRKVAGTSIEVALSTRCGPDDVITPVALPQDEELRRRMGGRPPQNCDLSLRELGVRDWASWVRRRRRPAPREHAHVREARRRTGRNWSRYLTFSVVRNPWDKAVSHYFWSLEAGETELDFTAWIRRLHSDGRLSNWPFYALGDDLALDVVLRYERLQRDFDDVCGRIGIDPPALPRSKSSQRPAWARDYRRMYDTDTASFVARACRREIEAFDYQFDPDAPRPQPPG